MNNTLVPVEVIDISTGEVLREEVISFQKLANYYAYLKKIRLSEEFITPKKDSGFGLDNLGLLVENGEFTYLLSSLRSQQKKIIKLPKQKKEKQKENEIE